MESLRLDVRSDGVDGMVRLPVHRESIAGIRREGFLLHRRPAAVRKFRMEDGADVSRGTISREIKLNGDALRGMIGMDIDGVARDRRGSGSESDKGRRPDISIRNAAPSRVRACEPSLREPRASTGRRRPDARDLFGRPAGLGCIPETGRSWRASPCHPAGCHPFGCCADTIVVRGMASSIAR